MASHVPFGTALAGASAEGFALAGDVHVWRGTLSPADYTSPTPDGRPATREFAGERLARVVCADRDMLDEGGISAIADALAVAQIERIASAIRRVAGRHPSLRTAVVTGLGAFIAEAAARAAGLDVVQLAATIGDAAARCAPAASVALLLERALNGGRKDAGAAASGLSRTPVVDTVREIGRQPAGPPAAVRVHAERPSKTSRAGAVCSSCPAAGCLRTRSARRTGGSSRAIQPRTGWPCSRWTSTRTSSPPGCHGGIVVTAAREAVAAIEAGSIPVLAPYQWLRDADPLPHSWEVTSDSIAAWVAGVLGATRLVLVKPPGATGNNLVDAYFSRALPAGVTAEVLAASDLPA